MQLKGLEMTRIEWVDEMAYRASLVAQQYEDGMTPGEVNDFRALLSDYVNDNDRALEVSL